MHNASAYYTATAYYTTAQWAQHALLVAQGYRLMGTCYATGRAVYVHPQHATRMLPS